MPTAKRCAARERADRRFAALELAVALGNVAEACRQSGMTRAEFYRFRQRHVESGLQGLYNRPPVAIQHPHAASDATVARVLALAIERPDAGCDRLSAILREEAVVLSGATIHKYLDRAGMPTRRARWLMLEEMARAGGRRLSQRQAEFVAIHNPCFGERRSSPRRPGERIAQDSLQVSLPGLGGSFFLHTAVDTFSNYAFARLHDNKRPESATALLHLEVLPYYAGHGLVPREVVTDGGREFHGAAAHPFSLYLLLNGIGHAALPGGPNPASGFSRRFHRQIRDGWLPKLAVGTGSLSGVSTLLAEWLAGYNSDRSLQGYPNHGQAPLARTAAWLATQRAVTQGR